MKKILSITAFAIIAVFALTSVALPTYAQGKGQGKNNAPVEGNGNGRAYGHFIAPGWLKKNDRPSTVGVTLPPGIKKKVDQNPGPVDTTAPVVSSIAVDAEHTAASVTWLTNEPAQSVVYVSDVSPVNVSDIDTIIKMDTDLETTHETSVNGLTPSTTYYALIVVKDEAGNTSTSSQFSFTTDAAPDVTAPIITNILTSADYDSALFTWTTNEAGNSKVYLSTSTPVDVNDEETQMFASSSLVTSHSVTATGLAASTTYYALVTSRDASGNTSTSSQFSFVTSPAPDTTAPVISAIALDASTSTLQVNWVTNEPATSRVYVSTSTGFGIGDAGVLSALDAGLTTNHQLLVTGLNASTTYYLRIRSIDAAFNPTLSNELSFTTQ